jgi:hypothetical protein
MSQISIPQDITFEKVAGETNRNFDENLDNEIFGYVDEHVVAHIILKRFSEIGYSFEVIVINFQIMENGKIVTEISFLFENLEIIAIVNAIPNLKNRDIEKHIERMEITRRYLERSRNTKKDLIGVLASDVFPDFVKQSAIEAGFYTIIQSDGTLKFDIPEDFKPRIF